jgi:hypothetical protein
MMISAVGRKKSTAANTQRLMEDVPLCAAEAIQRGPSTAAMLNSSTSQKPMARRNCDFGAVSSAIHPFLVRAECGFERAPSFYPEGQGLYRHNSPESSGSHH